MSVQKNLGQKKLCVKNVMVKKYLSLVKYILVKQKKTQTFFWVEKNFGSGKKNRFGLIKVGCNMIPPENYRAKIRDLRNDDVQSIWNRFEKICANS